MRSIIAAICLLLIFSSVPGCAQTAESPEVGRPYKVKRVVDGDTFWVEDGTPRGMKVRLIGIDAPEMQGGDTPGGEPFSTRSREFLDSLILQTTITLEFDVDSLDRYGRTLAYAYTADGVFVNAAMIAYGMAMVMTIPPNVKYSEDFADLQKKARRERRGLWGS